MGLDPTLLVVGATGQQGGALAAHLRAQKVPFRAYGRFAEKLRRFPHAAEGSLRDKGALKKALVGIKQAFLVTTPYEEGVKAEVEQGVAFVNAAVDCGVEHLVFSSVGSANQSTGIPHFESKWRIEEHIKKVGIPATILRPVFFMENFGSPWFFPQLERGALAFPMSAETPLQMVPLETIGAFAAAAFKYPEKFLGKEIDLATDELPIVDAVEKIACESAKPCVFEELSYEEGVERYGEDFAMMFHWFETTGYSVDLEALKNWGIPLVSFDEYLEEAEWVRKL